MAFGVSLTLVDAYKRNTTKRYEGTATTLAQSQLDSQALTDALGSLTLAGVVKETHSVDNLVFEAAQAGANIDAGATLHCRLNNGRLAPLKIPAVNASIINADGTVDISASVVTEFVALFEQTGPFRLSDGNYVVAVEYGELDR